MQDFSKKLSVFCKTCQHLQDVGPVGLELTLRMGSVRRAAAGNTFPQITDAPRNELLHRLEREVVFHPESCYQPSQQD